MNDLLLAPPIAFVAYVALVAALYGVGRMAAGRLRVSRWNTAPYASGEAPPTRAALQGYRTFFATALFFAMLHLGALVLASSPLNWTAGVFVGGLAVILVALSFE